MMSASVLAVPLPRTAVDASPADATTLPHSSIKISVEGLSSYAESALPDL
jgi:hypothetical protein